MPYKILPFDYSDLWTVETFTDNKAGSIHKRIPITADGHQDPIRQVIFAAETILTVQGQQMQMGFPLEATTLREALDAYPAAAEKAIDEIQSNMRRNIIANAGVTKLPRA